MDLDGGPGGERGGAEVTSLTNRFEKPEERHVLELDAELLAHLATNRDLGGLADSMPPPSGR